MRPVRLAVAASPIVVLAAMTGCSGTSDPPAATRGFFPARYTGATVVDAPLVSSGEVGPGRIRFRFRLSVPTDQAYALVIRCDRGNIEIRFSGAIEGEPCPKVTAFLDDGCAGIHQTVTVRVSEQQRGRWGVALYTGRGGAAATCF